MASTRREIDLACLDDLAIDGFMRGPAARSRQILGPEEQVALVIDGREVGRLTMADLLP